MIINIVDANLAACTIYTTLSVKTKHTIVPLLLWCCVGCVANSSLAHAAYAAKKAELAEERKRREAERAAAKEAHQQAMRDYMEHNFLQVPNAASHVNCTHRISEKIN